MRICQRTHTYDFLNGFLCDEFVLQREKLAARIYYFRYSYLAI
jgi:hypothetical protein